MPSLLALVESETHVCCRYRIAAFVPALTAAGHAVTIRALPRSLLARLRLFATARHFDTVVLQRKLLSVAELAVLRRFARRLLFDFDDAVWLRDSYSDKGFDSPRRRRRFLRTVAGCDAVDPEEEVCS